PDGGYGWVCAICSLFIMFSTWGSNASFGVFLSYYINNNTFDGATKYDFALIGGIIVLLAQILAPVAMLSTQIFGFYETLFLGVFLQALGYISSSFATQIWQLYLSQGVCVGISFAFLFIPSTIVLPTWFLKKRATAMGIAVAGTGLGGLIFALAANKLIHQTGDQKWALRMVGIVTTFVSLISSILITPRNYCKSKISWSRSRQQFLIIFDISVIYEPSIQIIAFWFGLVLLGYILIIYSLSDYAITIGLSQHQGSVIIAVLNTGQAVCRPVLGIIADKIGRVNFTIISQALTFILIFAFWINAKSYALLIAFSFLIGGIVGVGNLMNVPLTADCVPPERFPAAWSYVSIVVSIFCLVAEVIALAMRDYSLKNPYINTQIFSGCLFVAAILILLLLREIKIKILLKERNKHNEENILYLEKNNSKIQNQELKKFIVNNEEVTWEKLKKRKRNYFHLLKNTPKSYFKRCFFPAKI
ncbi:MCT family MFS transporter, partial [Ascoidea rubescens DSM 1968]